MTPSGPTRVRWFLVFWLFVLSAVSYLDRVNISIAGGAIVDAYHLTEVQLGNVFSALLAGYAVFQVIGGQLADSFGPRRVLTVGVVWWGVFTGLTALVPANNAARDQPIRWRITAFVPPTCAGSHLSGSNLAVMGTKPKRCPTRSAFAEQAAGED